MNALIENHIQLFKGAILISPIVWGIWEFRQFRFKLNDIYKEANDLNTKLDKIAKNNLDDFPLLKDIKNLSENFNKIFSISNK